MTTRVKRGGACETTKDCVAGNVCSKYYSKVSWNIFSNIALNILSAPCHDCDFKKGGAGVNGQAFMEVMVPVRSVYLCQDHDFQQDDSVRGIDHNQDEYETMTLTRTTMY